ncbi:hypothetical protein AK812_SmicGene35393 [Symbiodinium microadriaticum]|uniref:RRM domain-containing protein n=1 Tax=Symbiodinium microadriaticum TaxID=2951 RepID=A0A1Q9CLP7_SYMMI|nr:hypothetical protein AK812_SmicGene35393 [Symbiodinium microadriaticum]
MTSATRLLVQISANSCLRSAPHLFEGEAIEVDLVQPPAQSKSRRMSNAEDAQEPEDVFLRVSGLPAEKQQPDVFKLFYHFSLARIRELAGEAIVEFTTHSECVRAFRDKQGGRVGCNRVTLSAATREDFQQLKAAQEAAWKQHGMVRGDALRWKKKKKRGYILDPFFWQAAGHLGRSCAAPEWGRAAHMSLGVRQRRRRRVEERRKKTKLHGAGRLFAPPSLESCLRHLDVLSRDAGRRPLTRAETRFGGWEIFGLRYGFYCRDVQTALGAAALLGAGGGLLLAGPMTALTLSSLAMHAVCRDDRTGKLARTVAVRSAKAANNAAEQLVALRSRRKSFQGDASDSNGRLLSVSRAPPLPGAAAVMEVDQLWDQWSAAAQAADEEALAVPPAQEADKAKSSSVPQTEAGRSRSEKEVPFTEGIAEARAAKLAADTGGAAAAEALIKGPHLRGVRMMGLCATFDLGIPLDLAVLADKLPNTQYSNLGSLQLHGFRPHRYVATLNRRGRTTLQTSQDEEEARLIAKKVARLIKRHYSASTTFRNWKVVNLMMLANLPFRLHINDLAKSLHNDTTAVLSHESRQLCVEIKADTQVVVSDS